jgi:hypothetical protein
MKSILVGFADERGRSTPKIICGPEVPEAKQAEMFSKAKRHHRFPKGVARLELAYFDTERSNLAIRIPSAAGESGE